MVNRIIRNSKELFLSRQSTILGAATILMATVAASRILGLVRTRLLAAYFSPAEAGIYIAAFRLPDMVYNLLIFGALSVAFIPVFSDILAKQGREKAFSFASALFSVGVVFFGLVSVIAIIFVRPISALIAFGFNTQELTLMSSLSRILFVSQFVFVIGALFTSLLQSFKHFFIPAIAGVLYNIGIIIGIVVFTPFVGIYGPVYGVLLGSIFYLVIHLPLIKSIGYKLSFQFDMKQPGVRKVFRLMGPRTLAIAGDQLRTTFNLSVASSISASSVTYLNFAQQLYLVPVGLFIATMAQAVLPVLSQEEALKQKDLFVKTLITSLHQVLFLTMPAAAILIILRIPVVRLVFGASQFTWEATVLTGKTVAWLALGLVAEAIVMLFVRAYYALHDTKTPVKVALFSLLLDVVCSLVAIFVFKMPVWSLGLSATIGGYVSAMALFFLLSQRVSNLFTRAFFSPFLRMSLATFVMAVSLYIPIKVLDQVVFDTTRTINLLVLTGIASICGMIMYLFLTWLLRVKEAFMILNYVQNFLIKGKNAKLSLGAPEEELAGK